MKYVRQVCLKRGNVSSLGWVPAEKAKLGALVELDDEAGWMIADLFGRKKAGDVSEAEARRWQKKLTRVKV